VVGDNICNDYGLYTRLPTVAISKRQEKKTTFAVSMGRKKVAPNLNKLDFHDSK
jgi:hypothetical protein